MKINFGQLFAFIVGAFVSIILTIAVCEEWGRLTTNQRIEGAVVLIILYLGSLGRLLFIKN